MAQRIDGLYKAITIPAIYRGLQYALGADKFLHRYSTEILRVRPGSKVLDIGCGPANIVPYLPQVDYTGIDLNPKHIEYAQARYGNSERRFLVGNAATDLAHERGTFDLVKITALLHHLSDDECVSLFRAVEPLLNPSGRIVTLDNVWLPNQRLVPVILNGLDSGKNVRTPEAYLRLLSGVSLQVETRVFHDLLRIPYDHFVMSLSARDVKPETTMGR